MTYKQDIYSRQNSIFKLLLVLSGIGISVMIPPSLLLIQIIVTLAYMIVRKDIYINWLQTLLKLLPFFSSLILLGILFQISFYEQTLLIVRIVYFLLLSVYFISTTRLENFLRDLSFCERSQSAQNLIFLLTSTLYFVPIFYREYQKTDFHSQNFWENISEILHRAFDKIHVVERLTKQKIKFRTPRKMQFFPQLYLLILFMSYLIILYLRNVL